MVRAYFEIRSAERLLPVLAPLVRRAQEVKRELERYESVSIRRSIMTDGSAVFDIELLDSELQGLKDEFYRVVEEIESRGCALRNVDQGIIHFYTRFEGRDVVLCWQADERRIRHWHEVDEGFAGRKRIVELK